MKINVHKPMKKGFDTYLIENNFVKNFQTETSQYYRLNTECRFIISEGIISLLTKEYDSGLEKGGIFLVKPTTVNNETIFNVENVVFIKNIDDQPTWRYLADPAAKKKAKADALSNNLIPLDFHTHPTKSSNIVLEGISHLTQWETSVADRFCSLFPIRIGQISLRSPDILVVGSNKISRGIFVGFYGGLVAPTDFAQRKSAVTGEFYEKAFNKMSNFFDTPEKKILGAIAGMAAIFLFVRYPKAILPTVFGAVTLLPMAAYSSSERDEFFGVSHGNTLNIFLPKISDEIILADEKYLREEYEKKYPRK